MPSPTPAPIRRLPWALLCLLLMADVSAYLFEKIASTRAHGIGWAYLFSVLHQPYFWATILLAPVQLLIWTRILSRADLSQAYPISGLNMPLTLLAAVLLLHERLSWVVWTGAGLIFLGGAIIGPTGEHHPPQTPPG